ncbi:hypothetical protein [Microvirga sp. GCM10011540]|uniref:hypothetical protein n=1 Tax=Microvirga sp. GCM10011540 TaxID=3317338 RepID=UPI00366C9DE0
MRKLILAIAVAAGFAATPVLACPMHQAAAPATGSTLAAGPMMCGTPTATAQVQQPGQTTQPSQPGQSAGGICPCCRNMAMMQPKPQQPGDMQQDAPASPPAPSPAPEPPRPN